MRGKILFSCLGLGILVGCINGAGGTISGDKINQPGNLTTDVHAITNSGDNAVRIYNNGQMGVSINSGSITTNQTKDAINEGASDCFGKTLSAQQSCTVSIHIYDGEAGITELDLATNNGIYKLPINVDTSGGGVLETDTSIIATTKEKVISLYNKGAMPLTLSTFHMEEGDTTLIAKDSTDNHCLNTTLESGKACQIKVKASPAINKKHTLSVTTSNSFLKVQDLPLYEETDVNKVNLYRNGSSYSVFTVDTPEKNTFVLKNNGSDDINISKLDFTGASVGDVSSNTCNGAILQAGDTCNIELNVNADAHESGIFTINTAEKLESSFDYKVIVNSNNLGFADVNDAIIHANSTKKLNVVNSGNFDVKVDSVSYDSSLIQLDTSACNGVIAAHGKCVMPVKSAATKADVNIAFNEFGGGIVKNATLHINDGIAVIAQPKGNNYYATLPNDGSLYQVFSVVNNTDRTQKFSLTTQHNEIATFMRSNGTDIPLSAFIEQNCLDNDSKSSVAPQSQCEIIIKEPSDFNTMQPFEQSILQVEVDYDDTQDIFIHRYQSHLSTHNEHRDHTYQVNQILNPTAVDIPGSTQINQATLVYNNPHGTDNIPSSEGMVLSIEPDYKTIKITSFFISAKHEFTDVSYLDMQNNILTVTSATGLLVQHQNMPTASQIQFNVLHYDPFPEHWVYGISTIEPYSYCDDTNCLLHLWFLGSGMDFENKRDISFSRSYPDRDWTVIDSVAWKDLGTITRKRK